MNNNNRRQEMPGGQRRFEISKNMDYRLDAKNSITKK